MVDNNGVSKRGFFHNDSQLGFCLTNEIKNHYLIKYTETDPEKSLVYCISPSLVKKAVIVQQGEYCLVKEFAYNGVTFK